MLIIRKCMAGRKITQGQKTQVLESPCLDLLDLLDLLNLAKVCSEKISFLHSTVAILK